jgi:transposase
MEVIRIEFSNTEITQLHNLARNHLHPTVRQRALALVMKSENIAHGKIASALNICENTMREYFMMYLDGGISKLTEVNFRKAQSKFAPFEQIIREYFEKTPPSTMAQACAALEKLLGFPIKKEALRRYCKLIGLEHRKVGTVPGKVDIEAQQKFHDDDLQPRLSDATEGKRDVYFVDAAHFVMGSFLAYLWCFVRIFVRTPSGRQRFNVLGALNAITKEMITVTNNSYITSIQVCELLKKIADNATLPITIILDNARYQRCNLVMNYAKELGIELLFLPPYSPNLNLIERVWKFVKKQCLNAKYYDNFASFSQEIQTCVDTMHQTHADELKSLLTPNFQLFSEEQIKKAA